MQNGLAESSVGLVTMLGKTGMAESGLWFNATQNGVNCRNVTYKERLWITPYEKTYGVKKDVSKFRPFGCRTYAPEQGQKGERTACTKGCGFSVEAINLGFTTDCNTSGYKLLIQGTGNILISNQVRFDESLYPKQQHG